MSTASQVKETLASLKGLQSTIQTFAVHEGQPDSKELLESNAQRLQEVIDAYEHRLAIIEYQEPQYKGF